MARSQQKQRAIRHLNTPERAAVQKEYYRLFHRSLFTTVSERTGYDRTYVYHIWRGTKPPNDAIEAALWDEVQRLVCKEGETGNCPKCPLRKACERMAKG